MIDTKPTPQPAPRITKEEIKKAECKHKFVRNEDSQSCSVCGVTEYLGDLEYNQKVMKSISKSDFFQDMMNLDIAMDYRMRQGILLNYLLGQTLYRYKTRSYSSKEGEVVIRTAYQRACDIVMCIFNTHKRSLIAKVFAYILCNNLDTMNSRFSSSQIAYLLDVPEDQLNKHIRKG